MAILFVGIDLAKNVLRSTESTSTARRCCHVAVGKHARGRLDSRSAVAPCGSARLISASAFRGEATREVWVAARGRGPLNEPAGVRLRSQRNARPVALRARVSRFVCGPANRRDDPLPPSLGAGRHTVAASLDRGCSPGGCMMDIRKSSIADDFGSQARFVAAAQRDKPMAWKRVELLRAACALPLTHWLLPGGASTISPLVPCPPN
jgi:hypothetical protein